MKQLKYEFKSVRMETIPRSGKWHWRLVGFLGDEIEVAKKLEDTKAEAITLVRAAKARYKEKMSKQKRL